MVPIRDLDHVSALAAVVGVKSSVLQVCVEDIGPRAIGTNAIVALRKMKAELAAGLSIRRIRISVARGGCLRSRALLGQQ